MSTSSCTREFWKLVYYTHCLHQLLLPLKKVSYNLKTSFHQLSDHELKWTRNRPDFMIRMVFHSLYKYTKSCRLVCLNVSTSVYHVAYSVLINLLSYLLTYWSHSSSSFSPVIFDSPCSLPCSAQSRRRQCAVRYRRAEQWYATTTSATAISWRSICDADDVWSSFVRTAARCG